LFEGIGLTDYFTLSSAALRFFRICLKMNNRNLFNHLYKHDCFTPITDLTVREAKKENLLSSTCQEFFEFMRKVRSRSSNHHGFDILILIGDFSHRKT
jgi:protein phosphatase 4 regulatory subunit 3